MNPLLPSLHVETKAMAILLPWLKAKAYQGQLVINGSGRLAKDLQKTADVFLNIDDKRILAVEIKSEESNKYGNFFLETWSNRHWFNPGWMLTSNADVLAYYFIETDDLYTIPFMQLKAWAWSHRGNQKRPCIYDFPERPQEKYAQKNDTWGCCVPIQLINREVGFRQYHPAAELQPEAV